MQRESTSPDTSMEYTGKLYGKIGRAHIPLKLTSAEVDAKDTEIERLKTALQQAYVHNQNMHCFVTKGRLNDQLNEQTHLLRKALGIPDQQAPQESTIDTPVCRSAPPPSPTPTGEPIDSPFNPHPNSFP